MNRVAFVISELATVKKILANPPEIFHIYLINSTLKEKYPSPAVTNMNGEPHDLAGAIKDDIIKRRLIKVINDSKTKEIAQMVVDLRDLDLSFIMQPYSEQEPVSGAIHSLENCWQNIPHAVFSPNIDDIKNKVRLPIVLVGSGPSLNKNIDYLKKIQDKVIIMACGSAIGPLMEKQITPHFVVSIDPFPIVSEQLLKNASPKTTLLASMSTDYRLVQQWPGPKLFFARPFDKQILSWLSSYLGFESEISSSATVSVASLFLALAMGADPIIFIGHDFCFKSKLFADFLERLGLKAFGKMISKITYARGVKTPDNLGVQKIVEIKTVWGKKVKTDWAYKEVFDFFNAFVPRVEGRKIINATEGGAGIKGAEHKRLCQIKLGNDITLPEFKKRLVNENKIAIKVNEVYNQVNVFLETVRRFEEAIEKMYEENEDGEEVYKRIDKFLNKLPSYQAYSFIQTYIDAVIYWSYLNDTVGNKVKVLFLVEAMICKLSLSIEAILPKEESQAAI